MLAGARSALLRAALVAAGAGAAQPAAVTARLKTSSAFDDLAALTVSQSTAIGSSAPPGAGRAVWSGDAEFEIAAPGLGAYLRVALPSGAQVATLPRAVIAHSPHLVPELRYTTADTGVVAAVARGVAGAPLLLSTLTAPIDARGDVVIAPLASGDISIVRLDGNARYAVVGRAFLACTSAVALRPSYTLAAMGRLGVGQASGRGLLAIAGGGAIARVALQKGESFVVRTSSLLAWDERIEFTAYRRPGDSAARATSGGESELKSGAALARVWARGLAATKTLVHRVGDAGFVTLRGPGDVFLSSRLAPTTGGCWPWSRDADARAGGSAAAASGGASASKGSEGRFASSPFRASAADAPATAAAAGGAGSATSTRAGASAAPAAGASTAPAAGASAAPAAATATTSATGAMQPEPKSRFAGASGFGAATVAAASADRDKFRSA